MKKLAAIFGVLLLSTAMFVGCGSKPAAEAPATEEAAPAADAAATEETAPAADAAATEEAATAADATATEAAPAADAEAPAAE